MKTVVLFSFLITLVFTACQSKDEAEKVEKISTLLTKVEKIREDLNAVNLKEIKAIDSVFSTDIQTLTAAKIDFANPGSKVVVDYMKLRRPFSNFIRDYARTTTQLDSLQSRLYSLKTRVKKGNIQPEAYKIAFTQNNSVFAELDLRTRKMINSINQNKKLRDTLRNGFLNVVGKK